MLAPKIDKKKIIQYSAVLGIIFAIILYVVLTNFVFKGDKKTKASEPISAETVQIKDSVDAKSFDNSLIEDKKFKDLKENRIEQKSLSDLEIGKDNPFDSGENK